MLATKKQLAATQRDSEREAYPSAGSGRAMLASAQMLTVIHGIFGILDGEIDKLVYALYGLTEEEIKIGEGTA